MTALMVAARYGQLEVVQYLVEEGKRSVKFADEDGWTPFMYAAYNSNIDVMKYLCTKPKNDVEAVTKVMTVKTILFLSAIVIVTK